MTQTLRPLQAGTSSPSAQQVRRALAWMAALEGGDPQRAAAAHHDSASWRGADARHEAAWLEAERRWSAVAVAAGATLPETLRTALPLADPGRARPARRRWLAAAGGGSVAMLAAWLGWSQRVEPPVAIALRTGRAQHLRNGALPDGTHVWLAADTAVQAEIGPERRELQLLRGRIHLDVAHDATRPFIVTTRLARIAVLGTAFGVADRGHEIAVAVERGRVQVASGAAERQLAAGESVRIAREGAIDMAPAGSAAAADAAPWRTGWWRFVDAPLGEALAEVNAYLPRPVEAAPQAAALRLTGSFRLDEPERFIDTLPRVLPVRVVADAAGRRRVEPSR